MPAPTITPLPPAPLRSQAPATFTAKAEAFVDALEDLPGEINAFGAYLETLGIDPASVPELARDAIGAALVPDSGLSIVVNDGGDTITIGLDSDLVAIAALTTQAFGRSVLTVADAPGLRALALVQEWAPNFTSAGEVNIPARSAMTISQGNAKIGAGSLTYTKSTAAAPSTFSATTLPATLEAGAWLKVTSDGAASTHLVRTA